ncbi:lipid-A-disaccharide synthase [Rubellimicrobium roseum]|uniref:Lipid-A-disaccharide synthase n=1 Tax=Rubellimicrobium roseum TaxID=687525 RepID=A0A5C4NCD3_9RHOB|nr:lipid-A-disaccharide synthase [Rubellimicrobium roseum]TNC69490.1 lipid-A-disaccharide synthase [Rubellimicrobium roseum]
MRVFLVAGEPSGDRLGAAVMAGLRALRPEVAFDGVGGEAMIAEGLKSRFPMSDLSVMGLVEVLRHYGSLRQRLDETIAAVRETRPDILLTIDSPDFGLRVARAVRDTGVHCVHYVAPTIWAWRPGRAKKLRGVADQLLALFPFEPPLWEAQGIPCDFVGHPVVSEEQATEAEATAFRGTFGIGDAPLVLALPGSRRSEVERLSGRFGEALGRVAEARPGTRVVLPAAAPVVDLVRDLSAGWPVKPLILTPRADPLGQATKRAAFRAADVALAASGTVSLELAASRTPMVIAYDMAWLSWQIISRMVRLDTATLVNIVSDTRAVPEFLGPACRPVPISEALLRVMDDPAAQQAAMRLTMERLGEGGEAPGLRAARAILNRWDAAQAARTIQPPPSTRVPSGA